MDFKLLLFSFFGNILPNSNSYRLSAGVHRQDSGFNYDTSHHQVLPVESLYRFRNDYLKYGKNSKKSINSNEDDFIVGHKKNLLVLVKSENNYITKTSLIKSIFRSGIMEPLDVDNQKVMSKKETEKILNLLAKIIHTKDVQKFTEKKSQDGVRRFNIIEAFSDAYNYMKKNVFNPIHDHVLEPIHDHVLEPIHDHVLEPIHDHVLEPIHDHVLEPIHDHVLEPIHDHVLEPIHDHVLVPIHDHVLEPIRDHVLEPIHDNVLVPINDQVLAPINDNVFKPIAEGVEDIISYRTESKNDLNNNIRDGKYSLSAMF